MKLVVPDIAYKDKVKEYIQEFIDAGSSIDGTDQTDALLVSHNYDKWLDEVSKQSDPSVKIPGQVDASTFLYVREEDDAIVGMVNIRYGLNAYLYMEGGHVGFSVRPSERGKGIATDLLGDALIFCRLIGLNKVLIVCEKDNIASACVIQKCGGVLENEVKGQSGRINQRYWIENEGENECIF